MPTPAYEWNNKQKDNLKKLHPTNFPLPFRHVNSFNP
jgi:hypothetical protein